MLNPQKQFIFVLQCLEKKMFIVEIVDGREAH